MSITRVSAALLAVLLAICAGCSRDQDLPGSLAGPEMQQVESSLDINPVPQIDPCPNPPVPHPLIHRYAVIVVGGSIEEEEDDQFEDFENAADAMYYYLVDQEYLPDDIIYLSVNVDNPLVTARTTIDNINTSLSGVAQAADMDDHVFIYFAGHGKGIERDRAGGQYIIPADAVFNDPPQGDPGDGGFCFQPYPGGNWDYYPDWLFGEYIDEFSFFHPQTGNAIYHYGQLMTVLEFCHAGAFMDDTITDLNLNLRTNKGKLAITTCLPWQFAYGHPTEEYPDFTYYFLISLWAGNPLEQAFAYAANHIHQPVQTPWMIDLSPRFNAPGRTYP